MKSMKAAKRCWCSPFATAQDERLRRLISPKPCNLILAAPDEAADINANVCATRVGALAEGRHEACPYVVIELRKVGSYKRRDCSSNGA
jgi:hypothetical protein